MAIARVRGAEMKRPVPLLVLVVSVSACGSTGSDGSGGDAGGDTGQQSTVGCRSDSQCDKKTFQLCASAVGVCRAPAA
jgi:hypothetical protein